MTAPRVRCSAAGLWLDKHMTNSRHFQVIDSDGQTYVFCSACCLLEYAVYGLVDAAEGVQSVPSRDSGAAA